MERSFEPELLDTEAFPDAVVARAYRDLTRLHRFLGHTPALIRAIRRDPLPVRRVLDIGCGHGAVLAEIRDRLGVEVIGADLRPPRRRSGSDRRGRCGQGAAAGSRCGDLGLPGASSFGGGIGVSSSVNAGRSCRRFILIDLVRHWLPLALFRVFVAPFFSPVAVSDGMFRFGARIRRRSGRGSLTQTGVRLPSFGRAVLHQPDPGHHLLGRVGVLLH